MRLDMGGFSVIHRYPVSGSCMKCKVDKTLHFVKLHIFVKSLPEKECYVFQICMIPQMSVTDANKN